MTPYRQMYNKAKSQLAKKYNVELHTIMVELGYVKKVKEVKEEPKKEEKKVENKKK